MPTAVSSPPHRLCAAFSAPTGSAASRARGAAADYVADVRASTPSNAAERLVPDRRDIGRRIDTFLRVMDDGLARESAHYAHRLSDLEHRLQEQVRSARAEFDAVMSDLERCLLGFEGRVQRLSGAIDRDERLLRSFDPQGVLRRGYAIVRGPDGRVLREAASVDKGQPVAVQLAKGSIEATVTETR